jgi:hypothetical protein
MSMDSDSIKQLVGIAAFVFVAGLVFVLVDRLRRPVVTDAAKGARETPDYKANRRSAFVDTSPAPAAEPYRASAPESYRSPAPDPYRAPVAEPSSNRNFREDLARVLDEHNRMTDEQNSAAAREQKFRLTAETRLEPLLEDIVGSAKAHGQHAAYEMSVTGGRATYRLEVRRNDHPRGQPLPYLTIARGEKNDLAVLHGGMYPGPGDQYSDADLGWTEMAWGDLENAILRFAKRVFRQYAN